MVQSSASLYVPSGLMCWMDKLTNPASVFIVFQGFLLNYERTVYQILSSYSPLQ